MSTPEGVFPPIRECCGLRHPLPWAHKGEIICARCKQGRPPSDPHGSLFCAECEPLWEADKVEAEPIKGSIFGRKDGSIYD